MITKLLYSGAVTCVLCVVAACGSSEGAQTEAATPSGTGSPPSASTGTMAKPSVGAAGMMAAKPTGPATPAVTTAPPASTTTAAKPMGAAGMPASAAAGGGAMMASAGAAGASATTGAKPSSGAGGAAGGASAQSGAAGSASASTSAGGGYIRGPEPTMATAIGTAKGPYSVKSYTDGFKKGTKYLAGTLYYPDSGPDLKPPFGCVIVVPGFTAYQSSIMNWGPFLASNGIVTMTIDTLTTGDQPDQRAGELLDALNDCVNENERSGSPLMGKIDKNTTGLMGWSMGGGGTLIAASQTPTLKAVIGLCAWGPHGGAMNKVPALMFEGTADVLAASMSDGYYNQVPDSVPKMLFEVAGADHFYANNPASQMGLVGLYGLSWMKVFLEGDMRYKQFLTAPKPSITTNKFATNVK